MPSSRRPAVIVIYNAPGYLQRAWQSLIVQADAAVSGARIGNVVEALSGAIGVVMLLHRLPESP